ncbi:MAG: hypothetical protein ACXACY_26530 [Candidatus Hodarchaeales archaeon]
MRICKDCFHRSICKGQPNSDNQCNLYLKDGEIEFGNDISLNPTDTETFDDVDIERFFIMNLPMRS